MESFKKIINRSFKTHLQIGLLVRIVCVLYGIYHDSNYKVPYTDIDYKVFTDAAKHVYNGESPYKRHTYRYSPLIAYMLTPNIFLSPNFGKKLFCLFDLFNAIIIKRCVERQTNSRLIATYSAFFWIYNPMSIAISTRGNADSFPSFLLLTSLFFLQTDTVKSLFKYILSGVFLGISIHLRIYPLVLSFPIYLSLGQYKITRNTGVTAGLVSLLPNKKQILLTFSCILTLSLLTYYFYFKYGYEFLFETYIYHVFRKDTRHNFSVLFYYLYLTKDQLALDFVKVILQAFEFLILFTISLTFGTKPETLSFALFCQTVVLVAYNSVMTSQYFIWFLSLLPLVVHSFKITWTKALAMFVAWLMTQGIWLYFAYLIEFKCQEEFIHVWVQGISIFVCNIFILAQLIKCYNPNYGFGFREARANKKM